MDIIVRCLNHLCKVDIYLFHNLNVFYWHFIIDTLFAALHKCTCINNHWNIIRFEKNTKCLPKCGFDSICVGSFDNFPTVTAFLLSGIATICYGNACL